MAIMPTYNSQRNINANTAEPLRNEASKKYESDQQIIGAISEVAQKWSDANDVMEYAEAKHNYEFAIADIQARAAQDPNYKDTDKYYKELQDARNNSLVGISNKQIAEKAALDFDFNNKVAGIKIQAGARKKQIEHSLFLLDESLDLEVTKLLSASESEVAAIKATIDEQLNDSIEAGIITEAEAKKKKEQMEKSYVQSAINLDPGEAERMLTEGKFQHLSPEDIVSMLKVADAAKSKRKQEEKRFYADKKKETEDILQDKMFSESLSLSDLEKAAELPESEGGASRTLLSSYKKLLFSKAKERISDYVGVNYEESIKYREAIDSILDKDIDLIKARQLVIDAYADGKLTKEESAVLDRIVNMADAIKTKKMSGLEKAWQAISTPLGKLMQFAKEGYFSDRTVEEQAEDIKEFINGAYEEKYPPDEIFEKIKQRRQELNYPQYMGWEEGKTYETDIGTVNFIKRAEDGMPIVEKNGK